MFSVPSPRVNILVVWMFLSAPSYGSEPSAFLQSYCMPCHNSDKAKGEVNFDSLRSFEDFAGEPELLEQTIWVLEEMEMPPAEAKQPPSEDRAALLAALRQTLARVENSDPNDPGPVVVARLNQAEFNHTIRDLTGHDLKPARFFTPDPTSELGFANVGANLSTEPARIENYLAAAQYILRHAYVSPLRGLVWNPVEIDLSTPGKERAYLVSGLIAWHNAEESRFFTSAAPSNGETGSKLEAADFRIADYLQLTWVYRHRAALQHADATVESLATQVRPPLNPAVAHRWIRFLDSKNPPRMVDRFVEMARAVPGPDRIGSDQAYTAFRELEKIYQSCAKPRSWYESLRLPLAKRTAAVKPAWETSEAEEPRTGILEQFQERGFPAWATDFRENARYTAVVDLTLLPSDALHVIVTDAWDGNTGDQVTFSDSAWTLADGSQSPVQWPHGANVAAPSTQVLRIPKGAKTFTATAQLSDADKKRGSVQVAFLDRAVPDWTRHYIPGRQVLAWPERRGRVNTRVHHETALINGLTQRARSAITRRGAPSWLLGSHNLTAARLSAIGLADTGVVDTPYFLDTVTLLASASAERRSGYEAIVNDLLAQADGSIAPERLDAQARHILGTTLRRLFRRDLSEPELEKFCSLYQADRQAGNSFDRAVKRPLTVALVSPSFLFKMTSPQSAGSGLQPLSGYELASRLSYFLWASTPDDRLLDLAESGALVQPDVLSAEATRMLRDPRSRGLATEFAGRWLGFYAFDNFTQPDMDSFPEYTETLRSAMYEEAILFFQNLFADNLPITDLIRADYAYVNEELAAHYGIQGVQGPEMQRVVLSPALQESRGGIFGMGSLLTVTSTPLRSSPIYRGVWILDKALGIGTPEAPADVPAISAGERSLDGVPLHEQIARHRANSSCAVCHNRIDPPGLALEYYDAIGRWRSTDKEGKEVFARGELRDGRVLVGLEGVREFATSEQANMRRQFSRKLLAYALGRNPLPSDRQLIDAMMTALEPIGGPSVAVDLLIRSPQFRFRRDPSTDQASAPHRR